MLPIQQPRAALLHRQGADKATGHADGGGGTLVSREETPDADVRKDRSADGAKYGRVWRCESEGVRQLRSEALARNVCTAQ